MYVKLFASILTSSVWSEDMGTRLVWITLLALADKEGNVRSSPSGLARVANVSPADCQVALSRLLAPDPESGTPEYEGRRIEELPGGWHILNYVKYRAVQNEDDRREQWRESSKKYRDKISKRQQSSGGVMGNHEMSGQAEAEAEAEAERKAELQKTTSSGRRAARSRPPQLLLDDSPPAEPSRRKPKAPPQFAGFPQALCAELHAMWESELGGVDFARFRKAIGPLFRLPEAERPPAAATNDELKRALKLYTLVALSGKQAPFAASPDYAGARLAAIARLYRDTSNDSEQRLDGAQNIVHGQAPQRFTA